MKSTRILVAILDWGLGHAARSVVLIQALLDHGVEVEVAGHGNSLLWIQSRFPQIRSYEKPGIRIYYSSSDRQLRTLLLQTPGFVKGIKAENQWLKKHLEEHTYHGILSDNCYGMYHSGIPTVILTHQTNLMLPAWLAPGANAFLGRNLQHFNQVWVPDIDSENNLSGLLSWPMKGITMRYIGPISRFKHQAATTEYGVAALISGPEPQRRKFEGLIRARLADLPGQHIIFSGIPEGPNHDHHNVRTISHPTDDELAEVMSKANHIVCRSGYSSLMDLVALGKTATLVPTPGQPEQEYLAKWFHKVYGWPVERQRNIANWNPDLNHQGKVPLTKMNEDAVKAVQQWADKCASRGQAIA